MFYIRLTKQGRTGLLAGRNESGELRPAGTAFEYHALKARDRLADQPGVEEVGVVEMLPAEAAREEVVS